MYKVIIIEDEPVIRMGLVHTIDWASMDCVVAGEADNGRVGLALIREKRPDIVIADICMPQMDGLTMFREANELYRFSMIILTGYLEFKYAHEAIQLNVVDYLLKPIDERKLEEAVEKAKSSLLQMHNSMQYEIYKGLEKEEKTIIDVLPVKNGNIYVEKALQIIHDRYNTQLGLRTVAAELGVSESYLARKFKEGTGITFLDCLNQYRINQALKRIRAGGYRINEISDQVGFTQYKQFAVVFRRYVGMSCSDFLKLSEAQQKEVYPRI